MSTAENRPDLPPPPTLIRSTTVTPIASTTQADFDRSAPYSLSSDTDTPDQMVTVTLSIENLGSINDYSVRIELPALDENLRTIADIVYSVHAAAFAVNWAAEPPPEEES